MTFVRLLKTGLFAVLICAVSCSSLRQIPVRQSGDRKPGEKSVARRDINDVLRLHDAELMAIPGVVGVAVGRMKDKHTPCLKVLVVKKTREIRQKIPKSIEGYPVVLEETGIIRPM
jgi:hypothetical protein